MKSKYTKLQAWLIQYLRRGSIRVPSRIFGKGIATQVKERARVSKGRYRCEACAKTVRNSEYALDHTKPVIDPERGFVDWNTYIDRLYCGASGLKLLCKACHHEKTQKENARRRVLKLVVRRIKT